MEELRQEEWEGQTKVNELDIDEVLDNGGDGDETSDIITE